MHAIANLSRVLAQPCMPSGSKEDRYRSLINHIWISLSPPLAYVYAAMCCRFLHLGV